MAITLKPIQPQIVTFWIRGTSPLIVHAWSEKAKRMLRMTAQERKKQPKMAREPEAEAEAAAYKTSEGDYGFPLMAFKSALISAAHKDFGLEKTLLRKAFFLHTNGGDMITKLEYDDVSMREDMVRVGAGQTDLRYRLMFTGWSAQIAAEIDSELLTQQDVVNLVNRAGFSVGIGEMRPEKGGEFGRFELDVSVPLESVLKEVA